MRYEVRALGREQVATLLIEAQDEADARRQVEAQALRPLSVQRYARLWPVGGRRKSGFSLTLFTQELLTLLDAGLGVVEALDALVEKEAHADVRNVLLRLLASLHEGKSFSAALEALPDAFPPLYVNIVRAAERTSNLPEVLNRYVDYRVRLDAVKSKIVSAAIYPLILMVVGSGVCVFLMGYVVPRFAAIYQDAGRQLPWLSAVLMDWGRYAVAHRPQVLATAVLTAFVAAVQARRLSARRQWLPLLQRLPMLAATVRGFQLARLYLTLGMLLDGGLPVLRGLELVGGIVTPDMQLRLGAASEAIRHGESISHAFERCGLTTPVGLRLLRVGEQSGQIGAMMARIARVHDAEIARFIDRFSRVFEPVLMIAIGIVVGLIVVLLYMPIFDLAGSLQ